MKWHNKLEPAKQEYQSGQFLIARDVNRNGKVFKMFKVFQSIAEFQLYENEKRSINECHFFEMIDGPQRLYMDIDIKDNPDHQLADDAVADLVAYIKNKYHTQVNVYRSHPTTGIKQSYHIILANIGALDNIQCKKYIMEILAGYDDKYNLKQFIDPLVYKSNQQLRLLGSSKIGSSNIKVATMGTSPNLEDSFVSYYHNPNNIVFLSYI